MSNPEVLLISLVVVSTKLLYSLDGTERPPETYQDPRYLNLDWDMWQRALESKLGDDPKHLKRGEEYQLSSNGALAADKIKLDDFMDWFEKTWVGDGHPKSKHTLGL
jgi:RNA polymerase I-specific transcription initiation factor RRN7